MSIFSLILLEYLKIPKKRCTRTVGQERFYSFDKAKERCSNDEQCIGVYTSFHSKDFTLCDANKEVHYSDYGCIYEKTGISASISNLWNFWLFQYKGIKVL